MSSLPISGNGDITQNSNTPADGSYKLTDAGQNSHGFKLTIRGSDATSGNYNGGDIVFTAGLKYGTGANGLVRFHGNDMDIKFEHHGTYPRIIFSGESGIFNWPYNKNLYFGEDTYTGYFLIRGCRVGIGTDSPDSTAKVEVNGIIKAGSGGHNNGHFLLGSNHLWVDSNGKLRIKNGVPGSDTDGTVVGSQTL